MSEGKARAVLSAYRLLGSAVSPILRPYISYRTRIGKEDRARKRERFGHAGVMRPEGVPLVWIHAASVGETLAVAPLARAIAADGLSVLMTTGTRTSAEIVETRMSDCVIHQYVPLDVKAAVTRFLDHWKPDLAIFAESELWPVTLRQLSERRVPQVLVNARLSDRSFERWKKAHWFAEALIENFALVIAQSDIDAERYRRLGAGTVTVAGNLKADSDAPACDEAVLAEISQAIGARPAWAALSTHAGEEMAAATCHIGLKRRHRGLLTIIVPRHPDRGNEIAEELRSTGLRVAQRSMGAVPTDATDIFLGDTMGEMGLYLRLSDIAFIGKSLIGEGGQNPMEPAMLGRAILCGRYVQNFRDVYQRFVEDGACAIVRDEAGLTREVDALLSDPARRAAMGAAGAASVATMRGAQERTLRALSPYINPLKLAVSLDRRSDDWRDGRHGL
ncbi:lipid IV(A) 3-deoxy-D-manno-octulosonic acid transferase [Fulvimarina sp. 2208YS6-2-32]|uniref:3-deoxy-D-manno-octulosonic acid transferase n=1 Tax=Fulvimarina uroteuthidis TaxID=3098149 RepID=A0ABU5I2Z2_9HYPH|nr:lipid IV(A) 3-deoxy-D-manno-octulosonic acid transferase [Fulvimarina sp. 2208YS6-2-32]MDY8109338.1 lipid IV(A) 3-deoxy-D-manno-octulosonic acid transferase [Fulvimarina sp. 2208YS6-2-32]